MNKYWTLLVSLALSIISLQSAQAQDVGIFTRPGTSSLTPVTQQTYLLDTSTTPPQLRAYYTITGAGSPTWQQMTPAYFNYSGSGVPTSSTDAAHGYSAGSIYYDTIGKQLYACTDPTTSAAVWNVLGSGSSGVNAITGDGTIFNNSASTGNVVLSLVQPSANTILGNPNPTSSAAPIYTTNPSVTSIYLAGTGGGNYKTLFLPQGDSDSIAAGYLAGANQTAGTRANAFIGCNAGNGVTSGSQNFAGGFNALASGTAANFCVALGSGSLYNNEGNNVTGIGYASGNGNLTGTYNLFLGCNTGFTNATSGNFNILIGSQLFGSCVDVATTGQSNYLNIGNAIYGTGILGGTVKIGVNQPSPAFTLDVNGTVNATGAVTFGTPLPIASGGTGTAAAPTDAQIGISNSGGTAYVPSTISGDATLADTGAVTLATVNSNVGSFTSANITVNAKGLITAASSGGSGVSSFTGDGALINNSASTGSVTAALANAPAHSVWGNNNSSSHAPGYSNNPSVLALSLASAGKALFCPGTVPDPTSIACGSGALYGVTGGQANTAIGYATGGELTNGSSNLFAGTAAGLNYPINGNYNILLGGNLSGGGMASDLSNFLNIGDAIFGTGIQGGTVKIGINQISPQYTLDVSGATNHTGADHYTATPTSVSGSVGGSYSWTMPDQGSGKKTVIISLQALHDAGGGTIAYPVSFTNTPDIFPGQAVTAFAAGCSTTTSAFTLGASGTAQTGTILVVGY